MSLSNLPPQAYTRDTVLEAFNWLQTQPESVRQHAKTEDALVSLYLRAKRFGGIGSPLEQEAPISSKKFKSDLKNLAKGLRDFDKTPPQETTNGASQDAKRAKQTPPPPAPPQRDRPPQQEPQNYRLGITELNLPELKVSPQNPPLELDPLSHRQIRRTMDLLNLSSESEALRLLITLGAQSVQKLLD
jgi:hypothetical protein